jgi:hypothetical protein
MFQLLKRILIGWVIGSIGCGPARPILSAKKEPSPLPIPVPEATHSPVLPVPIAKSLGLRVLPQSYPSVRIDENRISFSQIIDLTQALYFVWPDVFLEKNILDAKVSHRILKGANQWMTGMSPHSAYHDSVQHRYYFSITDLVGGLDSQSKFYLSPADTQVTTLEMVLDDNTHVNIEIRFRARFAQYPG